VIKLFGKVEHERTIDRGRGGSVRRACEAPPEAALSIAPDSSQRRLFDVNVRDTNNALRPAINYPRRARIGLAYGTGRLSVSIIVKKLSDNNVIINTPLSRTNAL